MTSRRVRVGLVLAVAAAALGLAVPPVSAATTDFGTPSASSTFGVGVTFSQPVVLHGTPTRAEILVTVPGAIGPSVTEVPPGDGSSTLRFTVDGAGGAILPNTRLDARWRVTYDDGTVSLGPSIEKTYEDDRFTWNTQASGIVRVHWYQGNTSFGERALRIAKQGIDQAAQLLGVTESAPVDFYVYADQQAFYDIMGPATRENVGGTAIPEIRTLFALIAPDEIDADWVATVIPHELTHLVFDTATRNPYHNPPMWLNEGLADYLSRGYNAEWRSLVETSAGNDSLLPLAGLVGQFPTSAERFFLAYAESTSAIDFLIRTYGRDSLRKLIRSYAGGLTDDAAFSAALGVDTQGFAAAWLHDLGANEPRKYGPQPVPPGPLPSDWLGSPAPAARRWVPLRPPQPGPPRPRPRARPLPPSRLGPPARRAAIARP
jgi:hypothetical protein